MESNNIVKKLQKNQVPYHTQFSQDVQQDVLRWEKNMSQEADSYESVWKKDEVYILEVQAYSME